ncbi:MAG: ParA family protein, partial [Bacteroidota bacterium]
KEQPYAVKDIILSCPQGVDLLPSTKHLGASDHELIQVDQRQLVLSKILNQVKDDYDFVLIDTPPKVDNLTINALSASDHYIIPLNAEYFATSGLVQIMDAANRIVAHINPSLQCLGVLFNRYNPHKVAMRNMAELAEGQIGELIFKQHIRENIALMEAQMSNASIYDYDASSNGAKDYAGFTKEVLERLGLLEKVE